MLNPAKRAAAQHEDDEQRRGQVEGRDLTGQRSQRLRAIFANGEGHRAEGAERRDAHRDLNDAEDRLGRLIEHVAQRFAALAERQQGEAEQDRKQQHLQDIATGEGADDESGMMLRR